MYTTSFPQTKAEDKMRRARTHLFLDDPWFTISMHLWLQEDPAIEKTSVDGTTLRYNPAWVEQQPEAALKSAWALQTLRCGLRHPYRMDGRSPDEWARASEYVATGRLAAAGYPLWDGALLDHSYDELAVEAVYEKLRRSKQDGQQPPQGGQSDGEEGSGHGLAPAPQQNGQGDPSDGEPQEAQRNSESDWMIAAHQATLGARRAGRMPGELERALRASREVEPDCWMVLRRFVEETLPSGHAWSTPDRRLIHANVYLPGPHRENMPRLGLAIDTSGSIGPTLLDLFAAHLNSILQEFRPAAMDVIYVDAAVQGHEEFTPDGEPVRLTAKGGGGTLFQPALDWFSAADERPAAVIYLTDLDGADARLIEPDYPVLWATPLGIRREGAFGETIRISEYV